MERKFHNRLTIGFKPRPRKILIENGVAYTEDRIPVFNLYLKDISQYVTEQDLQNYFSVFGDLKSIEIYRRKYPKKKEYKFGFVNFKESKSAAAALILLNPLIRCSRIEIRLADSWKQPISEQEKNGHTESTETNENDPSKSPILRLNDECLLHICSFLTLGEKINLSETCVRLSGIVETIFRYKKTLTICDKEPLTLMQRRLIFLRIGNDFEQININSNTHLHSNRTIKLISHMCKNLRKIEVSNLWKPNPIMFREMGLHLHNLITINLPNCNINDEIVAYLAFLPNVENLNLSNNREITGKFLNRFPKLTHLNLTCCFCIEQYFFNKICERGTLKSLNIKRCENLLSYSFINSLLKLKHLENLSYTSFEGIEIKRISKLENLQELTIIFLGKFNPEYFKHLVRNKSEQLKSLTLIGNYLATETLDYIYAFKNLKTLNILRFPALSSSFIQELGGLKQLKYFTIAFCSFLKPKDLIKVLEQTTEIRTLDITGCYQITDQAFLDIAETIKKNWAKSPCTIYAAHTQISKNILENIKNMKYTPFVKLSFDESHSRNMYHYFF